MRRRWRSVLAAAAALAGACVPPPCGGMIVSPASPSSDDGADVVVHGETGERLHEFLRRQGVFGYSGSVLVVRRDTVEAEARRLAP